ncbi:MAG: hypothetical protein PUP91_19435 [Rhizonema sp. PD37]|nr:hypothetical protein [Rhizonema sp. PD37]
MLQAGEPQRQSPTAGNPPAVLARQRTGSSPYDFSGVWNLVIPVPGSPPVQYLMLYLGSFLLHRYPNALFVHNLYK